MKQAAYDTFTKPAHEEYVSAMLMAANPGNLKQVFQGYQSIPQPIGNKGFMTFLWNRTGKHQTPDFGGEYDEGFFKADREYQTVLQLPDDMAEQVGGGKLVIEIEVNTMEEVSYREGELKLYTVKKNWTEAEAHCTSVGGHLASALSDEEQSVLETVAGGVETFWLGGTNINAAGTWSWSDGSLWGYQNWAPGWGNMGGTWNCISWVSKNDWNKEDGWNEKPCSVEYPFICQPDLNLMKDKTRG